MRRIIMITYGGALWGEIVVEDGAKVILTMTDADTGQSRSVRIDEDWSLNVQDTLAGNQPIPPILTVEN